MVLTGVGNVSWHNRDGHLWGAHSWGGCPVDWEPTITAEEYTLRIPGIMFGALTVSATRAEIYVGNIEELDGQQIPDMTEESDAAIIAGFPQWSSVMTIREHYRYPEPQPPRYTCLVCGYPDLPELPVGPSSGRQDVRCPSCGFRFNHTEVDLHYTYEQWRELWIARGMSWSHIDVQPPAGWAPAQQVARVAPPGLAHYICLVCGYPDLTKPYGDFFNPTYEICPCCGYQYGYDDCVTTPINWRTRWIDDDGMRWWGHGGPPANWDPHEQLRRLEALPRKGQVNGVNLTPTLSYF